MAKWKNILLGAMLLSGSCNDEGKTSAAVNNDTVNNIMPVTMDTITTGCYSQISGRDTALLQINTNKGAVTGTLSYNIYQKDRNDGSVQGELVGDTLRGWYLFKSEGVMSVRQVAWRVKSGELWPGVGEMAEQRDTMKFADPDKLKFDNSRPFKKVECVL
jgi:hypothetical protein